MVKGNSIKLIECPRDAMQGWTEYIPVEKKIIYLNSLLKVGFDTLDFGSFVSPKAIPQLRDTREVLAGLDTGKSKTKLLAIVANQRGAEEAVTFSEIFYLGYPFSVSEEFQRRNTKSTIEESLKLVESVQNLCVRDSKELVIYISMGFGNPYGEVWNAELVMKWIRKLSQIGIKTIALSDTIGAATKNTIQELFSAVIPEFTKIEFGAHLHSSPATWKEKVQAALDSGCRRFDSAMKGIGGCPMADDELVGNLPTESLVEYIGGSEALKLDSISLNQSLKIANEIFH